MNGFEQCIKRREEEYNLKKEQLDADRKEIESIKKTWGIKNNNKNVYPFADELKIQEIKEISFLEKKTMKDKIKKVITSKEVKFICKEILLPITIMTAQYYLTKGKNNEE